MYQIAFKVIDTPKSHTGMYLIFVSERNEATGCFSDAKLKLTAEYGIFHLSHTYIFAIHVGVCLDAVFTSNTYAVNRLWTRMISNQWNDLCLINQSINQSIIYLTWSVRLAEASLQVRQEIKIKNGKIKTTLEEVYMYSTIFAQPEVHNSFFFDTMTDEPGNLNITFIYLI